MALAKRIIKPRAKKEVAKTNYGVMGAPINRSNPFYFGFIATLGGLCAIVLLRALGSVSQVFVLILIALFLATGLNPAVEAIRSKGVSRVTAVGIIFVGVISFVIFFRMGCCSSCSFTRSTTHQ